MPYPPKAIIFDFDGVLFDSETVHGQAFVETLAEYGVEFDLRAGVNEFIGLNDKAIIKNLRDRYEPLRDVDASEIGRKKSERYARLSGKGFTPTPGVLEFLGRWHGRAAIGICSGSRRVEIERLLKLADLDRYFSVVVSADDVSKSKPDSEGYVKTIAGLSNGQALSPSDCLVFEDSVAGVAAAKAAGMAVIGIKRPYTSKEALGVSVMVDDFLPFEDEQSERTLMTRSSASL